MLPTALGKSRCQKKVPEASRKPWRNFGRSRSPRFLARLRRWSEGTRGAGPNGRSVRRTATAARKHSRARAVASWQALRTSPRHHKVPPPRIQRATQPLTSRAVSLFLEAIELFRSKRPGQLSSPISMEGAPRWVSSSETTVRCQRAPACPKPHATVCSPSSVPATRPPRHPLGGTRRRHRSATASTGRWRHRSWPTRAAPGPCGRAAFHSAPPGDGRARPWGLARATAPATLPTYSPRLAKPLAKGGRRREATARSAHRAADAATPRAPDRGKNPPSWPQTGRAPPAPRARLSGAYGERAPARGLHGAPRGAPGWGRGLQRPVRGDGGARGRPSASRGIGGPSHPRSRARGPRTPRRQGGRSPRWPRLSCGPSFCLMEPAMGGRQRSPMVGQDFRHRHADGAKDAVGLWAGLWNVALS